MTAFFNDRLRSERKRIGLNQASFAAIGGVTRDTQLNYENGSRNPDSLYLCALAAAGVNVQFIISGVNTPTHLDEDEVKLVEGYRSLDSRGKAGVLALIAGVSPA
jgi:transcriptional regulator with XRE-family HTH domain